MPFKKRERALADVFGEVVRYVIAIESDGMKLDRDFYIPGIPEDIALRGHMDLVETNLQYSVLFQEFKSTSSDVHKIVSALSEEELEKLTKEILNDKDAELEPALQAFENKFQQQQSNLFTIFRTAYPHLPEIL